MYMYKWPELVRIRCTQHKSNVNCFMQNRSFWDKLYRVCRVNCPLLCHHMPHLVEWAGGGGVFREHYLEMKSPRAP